MKFMLFTSRNRVVLAGLALSAAGALVAQASSSIITFSVDMSVQIAGGTFVPGTDTVSVHGTFNGWGAGLNLVLDQDPTSTGTVYTNTVTDTSDANGAQMQYLFVDSNAGIGNSGYEKTLTGQNRCAYVPATSGGSLILPTPFFADAGSSVANNVTFQVDVSQQIALGTFVDDGSSYVEVRGGFNGWSGGSILTHDPTILRTNQFGLVTSNVWTGVFTVTASPAAAEGYKFVLQPGTIWESVSPANADGGGNRFFANVQQTLPIFDYADAPFAPLSYVTFSVDMSAQALLGNWNPGEAVDLAGAFNNWSTSATPMTNNPTSSNTNIYYAVATLGEGSTAQYKFTFQGASGTSWESPAPPTLSGNRFFTVPLSTNVTLPTVFYSDQSVYDLLTTNVWVTFSVDMAGASQYPGGPAFTPPPDGSDSVYVNSPEFTGSWLGWDPISLGSYQLVQVGSSTVYTNTLLIPLGAAVTATYKYGINAVDNEAAQGNNHGRVIRSLATGVYSFPTDTFGQQYNEPAFGQLALSSAPGGSATLSWLGSPSVLVQTSTNLAKGGWVSHPETSGAVWSTGVNSTNGWISTQSFRVANGGQFFRLIQQ
jgi:hypothetical protein